MTRTIPIKIQNEYIIGDKVPIGAAGSHNDVVLRMEFSPMWDGLTKTAQFQNALATDVVNTAISSDMLESGSTNVYLVPVPNGAKKYAGAMTLALKGVSISGENETRATLAVYGEFDVEESKWDAVSQAEQDVTPTQAEKLQKQIDDVKGNVATLEVEADEIRTQLAGKIDNEDAYSLIDQEVGKITLTVASSSSGSTFTMKKDGVEITSQTVDLHVKALNVDGEITADAIDLSTAKVSGKLSAQYIDVENLSVKNANIESLYASKIVGGSNTSGGYVPSAAISDSGHSLSELYVSALTANSVTCGTTVRIGGAGSYVTVGGAKVTLVSGGATTEKTWEEIMSGGGAAVFG
nr:MAG TPA: hypothetical protein [Caudoviricetes sp.]